MNRQPIQRIGQQLPAGANNMQQQQQQQQYQNLNIQRPPSQSSPLINTNSPHDINIQQQQQFDQMSMINQQQQQQRYQQLNGQPQQTNQSLNPNTTTATNQFNPQIRQINLPVNQQQPQQQQQHIQRQQQQQQVPVNVSSAGVGVSSPAVAPLVPPTQSSGNNLGTVNEQEKRKLIQQQLVLLLHAHKCSQRPERQCNVPHCGTMRNVLAHMTQCTEGRNCKEAHCASSRQIIAHWKNCNKPDCPVCNPLRNNNNNTNTNPNNTQRIGAATNSPNNSSSNIIAPNSVPANQQLDLSNQTNTTGGSSMIANTSSQGGQQQQQTVINLQQQPQPPQVHKPWHDNITNEMRKHLVQKIIQTIFPTQDHNIYRDPRLSNLVGYAVKTECEMYEQAKDQEEYFHLLAERIYKIQKEFEDKQRTRNNSRNTAAAGAGANGQQQQQQQAGNPNTPAGGAAENPSCSQVQSCAGQSINPNDLNTFHSQLTALNVYNPGKPNESPKGVSFGSLCRNI